MLAGDAVQRTRDEVRKTLLIIPPLGICKYKVLGKVNGKWKTKGKKGGREAVGKEVEWS